MSKPLELTVYEVDPTEPSMVVVEGFWAYRPYDPAKRLTDAELAAEFWKSGSDHYAANSMHMMFEDDDTEQALSDSRDFMFAMERFATLPHYDEDQP
jgi:hypothetical protein